jgi:hypothetical protein
MSATAADTPSPNVEAVSWLSVDPSRRDRARHPLRPIVTTAERLASSLRAGILHGNEAINAAARLRRLIAQLSVASLADDKVLTLVSDAELLALVRNALDREHGWRDVVALLSEATATGVDELSSSLLRRRSVRGAMKRRAPSPDITEAPSIGASVLSGH